MFCRYCGKEIPDNAVVCINCGVPVRQIGVQQQMPVEQPKGVNGLGLAGFIVSIFSLYFGLYFCVIPVVSLILSIVGMVQAKRFRLNGFAIAGLTISIIALAFWLFIYMLFGLSFIYG